VDFDTPDAVAIPVPGINGEHQVQRNQLLVRVGYGLTDQLEAFVKMGGTSSTVEDAFLDGTFNLNHDLVGNLEFTIVGGLDATLLQSGDFRLGANGQVSYFTINDTDVADFTGTTQFPFAFLNQSLQGDVWTFEGALLASYTLGKFTPYGGICMYFSHSDNRYEVYTPGLTPIAMLDINAKQEEWFGGVCGLKVAITDNVHIGIEMTGVAEGVGLSTGVTVAL
jgi:opacity protein-like surface antigen